MEQTLNKTPLINLKNSQSHAYNWTDLVICQIIRNLVKQFSECIFGIFCWDEI